MTADHEPDIIVVGGGIAGCAAALRAAQNNMHAVLIAGTRQTRKRSRSQWVVNIDNMIGIHEGVLKGSYTDALRRSGHDEAAELLDQQHYHISTRAVIKNTMERLAGQYAHQVTVVEDEATGLEQRPSGFTVTAGSGQSFVAPAVVLATGIMDRQPQIQVIRKDGVPEDSIRPIFPFANREFVLYCIRCEGHLTRSDDVAVLGHSRSAAEVAFIMHERYGNRIILLTNGEAAEFTDDQQKICTAYGIRIMTERITALEYGEQRNLCCLVLDSAERINVRYAIPVLGTHRVYNDLARQVGAELADPDLPDDERQVYISYKGESSIHNLFVVGDAARRRDEPTMKQIYTAQEYAVRAVDTLDYRLRLEKRKAAVSD